MLQRNVISAITELTEEGSLPAWISVLADASILARSKNCLLRKGKKE
jgi:hypothetical protein